VRAVNFNITDTKKSLQSTFSLIWNEEKSIKEECIQAFKSAYLTDGAAIDAEPLGNYTHTYMCTYVYVYIMSEYMYK
jgi:hypothetical protein